MKLRAPSLLSEHWRWCHSPSGLVSRCPGCPI